MDYTQVTQSGKPEIENFFTTGAGADFEHELPVEPENNLNLNNIATEWRKNHETSQSDIKAYIPRASEDISSTEHQSVSPEQKVKTIEVDLQMPPTAGEFAAPLSEEVVQPSQLADIDLSKIQAKERLDKTSLQEVYKAERKLNQDGNTADFYEIVRQMTQANLNNTHGERSAWKEVA